MSDEQVRGQTIRDGIVFVLSEREASAAVGEHRRVLAVGNRTKPPLSRCEETTLVSFAKRVGMIQYEPSEFTFTAHAGTKVSDIAEELASRGQYLPFDPMLASAGATLGGTVASGIAGPGRFRYGGVRDFLLGARMLCGDGTWTDVGGKVVKNAAGFDIPKLLVGSLGRYGLISELTFKVFPRPISLKTLCVTCEDDSQAMDRIAKAAGSRWELDAIEYLASGRQIYLRLGGPADVNDSLADEICVLWGSDVELMDDEAARRLWQSISDLSSSDSRLPPVAVMKVPTTHQDFVAMRGALAGENDLAIRLAAAGATTWIRCQHQDALTKVAATLADRRIVGLCVLGSCHSPWIGNLEESPLEGRIKQAMDPTNKFPSLCEKPIEIG